MTLYPTKKSDCFCKTGKKYFLIESDTVHLSTIRKVTNSFLTAIFIPRKRPTIKN